MLQLRYYQNDAIEYFFDYTATNWGKNPLVVIPTAGGKSIVQASIIQRIISAPQTRVLLLTHQQELIKQNYIEFTELMNDRLLDVGIYSAGLKLRDTRNRIIFAGIQSVYKKAWELGFFDVILIDEAHLVPHKSEGMYRTFLDEMKKVNKNVIIGGFTATAYRLKGGMLTEGDGHLYNDICYEVTIPELVNPNHAKNRDKVQYLCELISPEKAMKSKVDLSKVHIFAGEYNLNEMEKAFNADDLVERSVKEILEYSAERKKCLVFTAGIDHCQKVADALEKFGQTVGLIHSELSDMENQIIIDNFKTGKIKYLVNVNILTTGFNVKDIDCIAVLRSTCSPGLWVQMCGRGSRLHPNKINCLILDFGGNIERHGPIDKIEVRKKAGGGSEVGTAPMKACPVCEMLMPISVMVCIGCGYQYPVSDRHEDTASGLSIMSKWKKPETFEVSYIDYQVHVKEGKPKSLRVKYYVNDYQHHDEYVCPMHEGFAGKKAKQWLDTRMPNERLVGIELRCIEDIIQHKDKITEPSSIIVDFNDKFPRITGFIFEKKDKEEVEDATAV